MIERMIVLDFDDGETGGALGNTYRYFQSPPVDVDLVYMMVSNSKTDAGLTVDLNSPTATLVAALACASISAPGTWISTALGGANASVRIPANTICSLDANTADVDDRVHVQLWCETAE